MGGGATRLEGKPARDVMVGMQFGGFTLVRQLGAGGMGQTWEAVRRIGEEFEQRVAIKLASAEVLADPYGRALLCREASLAASLRHPNIAAVLDWSEAGGYIVCELVEGADLRAVMRATPSDRFPAALLTHVLEQVARGLSHAHRRVLHGERSPVIHRDVSPGNIVADYDGNLKLVDFGIAKAVRSPDRTAFVQGKLPYMAPEQARGEPLDHSVDQYGLGVMAYEAACGVRPHDGASDHETLTRILQGDHVPISKRVPELPSGLAEIIERMISVERADRFANLDAVIDALEPFSPPPNVHRWLSALVHRARPEETIVEDDHGFVSLPVQLDPPWDESGRLRGTRVSRAPALHVQSWPDFSAASESGTPLRPHDFAYASEPGDSAIRPVHDGSNSRGALRRNAVAMAGVAIVLGLGAWILLSAPRSDYLAQLAVPHRSAERPASPVPPIVSRSPERPIPAATLPPQAIQATPPAASPSGLPASASPPMMSPPMMSPPMMSPPMMSPPMMSPPFVPSPLVSASSVSPSPKRSTAAPTEATSRRARASGRARPESAAGVSGTIRVRVFPWGRVWVDGEVVGSVPPILELKLQPGAHVVAVGREAPAHSQEVSVVAGRESTLSFDLEGW
jgi:serine/threonine protein kinase